ncbi:MAG TPA: hypothetical protein VFT34_18910 [Verrucomicrobiae bacterium]|nr:hypothetical protein [Verrucomicrobiae bacterium]
MKTTHCSPLLSLVAVLAGNPWIPSALANNPPTLNAIPDQTFNEDAGDQVLLLAGISSGAPEEQQTLTVTAVSSNPSLIPAPAVQYTSPNSTGTLLLRPAADAFGTATITVIVNDGQPADNIVARSFFVTATAVNDLPQISAIEDRIINEGTATGPLPFTVRDVETPASSLIVSGTSSNPALVPTANLAFGGSGTNRTLTVIPAPNQFGTATIRVTVADTAGATASSDFLLTVNGKLQIKMAEASPIVIWSATNAVLQQSVEWGQWEDMQPEPTSPYSVQPSSVKFYRLRKR